MFRRLLRNEITSIVLIILGLLSIVSGAVLFLWLDFNISTTNQIDSEKFGQFGDFIGGIVGSIWGLAGVVLFYIALTEQRTDIRTNQENLILQTKTLEQQVEEFKLQREELQSSRKVYEQQSKTLKAQQFESNFYSLLNIHLSLKESLNKLDPNNDYFKKIFESICSPYNPTMGILNHHKETVELYLKFYSDNQGHLSNYFKSFYRILKVIDLANGFSEEEKYFYSKILRSFLSDYEELVMYYNSHSIMGIKARPLLMKYNLLKHTHLFEIPHFTFYSKIQNNNSLWLFSNYLTSFLIQHLNNYNSIDFNEDKIVEKYDDSLNCLVGIYFSDDIEVKIFCEENISTNGINLTDDNFSDFIHDLIYERIILN